MQVDTHQARSAMTWVVITFMTMSVCFSQDLSKRNHVEDVFIENINDTIRVEVKLKYDDVGLPQYYFCHVNTPVCEHGLCKLMVIDVYWDVLGNFLRYELPPDEPLTKFDHIPFTEEDYTQLNKILADRASILRDYPVDDLVDHRLVRKSEVVDAVSAATRVAVKEAIVSGAVYSTYALWHIVNGRIASRIAEHTNPLISEELVMKMFYSDNVHYQYFALNYYPPEDSLKYLPEVIHLVKNGVLYIPYFAVEKIPLSAWSTAKYQISLLKHFGDADFQLQNAYLGKIANVRLCSEALDMLAASLGEIRIRQLMKVLNILNGNKASLTAEARGRLALLSTHSDTEISQQATYILESSKERN